MFTQLRWLSLQDTQVSDAGLEQLRRLSRLEMLDLVGTRVTERGVEEFQKSWPKCKVLCKKTDSSAPRDE
jgi:hypothetical protein